jgi:hypothetical protein
MQEEADDLGRSVGAGGIGEGPRCMVSGPGVATTMHHPVLEKGAAVCIVRDGSREGAAAGRGAADDYVRRAAEGGGARRCYDRVTIGGTDSHVSIAMEHDQARRVVCATDERRSV